MFRHPVGNFAGRPRRLAGHVFERLIGGHVVIQFTCDGMLRRTAVEIAAAVVGRDGNVLVDALPPAMHHRGELMLHGAIRIVRFDFFRNHHREILHPFFAFGLEGAPCGIVPVDDGWDIATVFRFPTSLAGIAVAWPRPEKHVEEDSFKGEKIEDFVQLF